jgi:hypothetical protein
VTAATRDFWMTFGIALGGGCVVAAFVLLAVSEVRMWRRRRRRARRRGYLLLERTRDGRPHLSETGSGAGDSFDERPAGRAQ